MHTLAYNVDVHCRCEPNDRYTQTLENIYIFKVIPILALRLVKVVEIHCNKRYAVQKKWDQTEI